MQKIETIKQAQAKIIEEFAVFDDWMDKYTYLIELGNELSKLDVKFKNKKYLIKGCQSRVWLHAEEKDKQVTFHADSDALIVKGIIALLLRVFSKRKAKDIIKAKTDFINEIGLNEHLSPTRSNGLQAMIKQIKLYAMALSQSKNENK